MDVDDFWMDVNHRNTQASPHNSPQASLGFGDDDLLEESEDDFVDDVPKKTRKQPRRATKKQKNDTTNNPPKPATKRVTNKKNNGTPKNSHTASSDEFFSLAHLKQLPVTNMDDSATTNQVS